MSLVRVETNAAGGEGLLGTWSKPEVLSERLQGLLTQQA